jgi:hypothetical protein
LGELTLQQKRHLFRASMRSRLEAASSLLNGVLDDFLCQCFVAQLGLGDVLRALPKVRNSNLQGLLYPFLLRRELQVPA